MSGAAGGAYGRFPCRSCTWAWVDCCGTECEACKVGTAEGNIGRAAREQMELLAHGDECPECMKKRAELVLTERKYLNEESAIKMQNAEEGMERRIAQANERAAQLAQDRIRAQANARGARRT